MKLAINHRVETQGIGAQSSFRIEANAKAFQALSSTLYADKISAVLREVGCNAQDSHIAAGIQRPIEVKLPNAVNQEFYIQDFGVGLDHDQVKGLYTTYFSSTKDSSNAEVGGFGLGSKSPFAYTDSFTVEAVKNGSHRTYAAFMGPDGGPRIALIQERPADPDWTSGVKIGFAIKPTDVSAFQNKALEIFAWFTPLPVLLGVEIQAQRPTVKFESEHALITGHVNTAKRIQSQGPKLLMGGILYDLDSSVLQTFTVQQPSRGGAHLVTKQMFNGICGHLVILKAAIGEVDVAISREALSYTPTCVENLRQLILRARSEVADLVQNQLAKAPTCREKYEIWHCKTQALELAIQVFNLPLAQDPSMASCIQSGQVNDLLLGFHGQRYERKTMADLGYQVRTTSHTKFFPSGLLVTAEVDAAPTQGAGDTENAVLTEAQIRTKLRALLANAPEDTRVILLPGSESDRISALLGVPLVRLSEVVLNAEQTSRENLTLGTRACQFNVRTSSAGAWPEPLLSTSDQYERLAIADTRTTCTLSELGTPGYFLHLSESDLRDLQADGSQLSVRRLMAELNPARDWLLGQNQTDRLAQLTIVSSKQGAKWMRAAGWTEIGSLLSGLPTAPVPLHSAWDALTRTYKTETLAWSSLLMGWFHHKTIREEMATQPFGQYLAECFGVDPDIRTLICYASIEAWASLSEVPPSRPDPLQEIRKRFEEAHPYLRYRGLRADRGNTPSEMLLDLVRICAPLVL